MGLLRGLSIGTNRYGPKLEWCTFNAKDGEIQVNTDIGLVGEVVQLEHCSLSTVP